jgi:hypothetical protein
MGFADRPEGSFVGEVMDPVGVRVDAEGLLRLDRAKG